MFNYIFIIKVKTNREGNVRLYKIDTEHVSIKDMCKNVWMFRDEFLLMKKTGIIFFFLRAVDNGQEFVLSTLDKIISQGTEGETGSNGDGVMTTHEE